MGKCRKNMNETEYLHNAIDVSIISSEIRMGKQI